MNFTDGQSKALQTIDLLKQKFPNGGGILIINGPAGTGKSSLIRAISDQVPDLIVLAPTGKAALRIKEVAFCNALTLHRWMYIPDEDPETGEVYFRQRLFTEVENIGFHSIIIDEASMIGKDLWTDVKYFADNLGLNIILIGDEFQLPPVDTEDNFSIFSSSFQFDLRVDLTEILRQALDSPIIRAATAVRTGVNYTLELSKLPLVNSKNLIESGIEVLNDKGVVICHRNETRHDLNNKIRTKMGRILGVEPGEPILVIKNNYDLDMFNGEIFHIKEVVDEIGSRTVKDRFKSKTCYMDFNRVILSNTDECIISQQQLDNKSSDIGFKNIEIASKMLSRNIADRQNMDKKYIPYLHTNYGYVLSCHKMQGNEAKSVLLVMEPSIKIATLQGRKFLYTGLTRAKENIKLCWI